MKAPKRKSAKFRFWLWPIRITARFWKKPIPPGLWFVNKFHQSVLDINNDVPWMVHFTSRVVGNIEIGENVWKSFALSGGCYIQGGNGIIIGDDTIFAPNIKLISANHDKEDMRKWLKDKPIVIGKNCWIGTNAVILPGVQLGDNVIVAAGSVVSKSFESNSIIAGVPARKLKQK